MYTFSEVDLAQMFEDWSAASYKCNWWWYRDVILNAQERGLVNVTAHTDSMPFWWRGFSESIELSEKMKEAIVKLRARNAQ